MRFSKHPTWRMLEEGKECLKLLWDTALSADVTTAIEQGLRSLHSLQTAVEDELVSNLGDSDE